jgi:type IV pilus assembly protein PilW
MSALTALRGHGPRLPGERVRRHATRGGGFSLVELMVAMVIGGMLMVMVVTTFSLSRQTSTATQAHNVMQEAGRVALSTIEADARMVGFRGCNSNGVAGSSVIVNQIITPTTFLDHFVQGVVGHEADGGGSWDPALPLAVSAAFPQNPLSAPESDVLTLRVATAAPTHLSVDMASGTADVTVQNVAGFSTGTRAVISDCSRSVAFRVTGVAGSTLAHGVAENTTANFGRAYGTDAIVVPFRTVTYFVAASSSRPNGDELSLWRMVNNAAATELVENVESFQVYFGEDTAGEMRADSYVAAPDVADWGRVIAVQVALLLRGPRDARNTATQTYAFNGDPGAVAADARLRRPYAATIHFRNRTL